MTFLSRLVWGLSVLMATFTVVVGVYLLVTEATWEDVKWWVGLGALFANLAGLALAMCLSWLAPTLVIVLATMLGTLWCANIRPKVCASILLLLSFLLKPLYDAGEVLVFVSELLGALKRVQGVLVVIELLIGATQRGVALRA